MRWGGVTTEVTPKPTGVQSKPAPAPPRLPDKASTQGLLALPLNIKDKDSDGDPESDIYYDGQKFGLRLDEFDL